MPGKTLSLFGRVRELVRRGFSHAFPMLIGCLRVSSDSERQNTDLQRDALLAAGTDRVALETTAT